MYPKLICKICPVRRGESKTRPLLLRTHVRAGLRPAPTISTCLLLAILLLCSGYVALHELPIVVERRYIPNLRVRIHSQKNEEQNSYAFLCVLGVVFFTCHYN